MSTKKASVSTGRKRSKGEIAFDLITTIIGLLISIVFLYPIYYVFIASISKPFFVSNGSVMFWPMYVTFDSYLAAIKVNGLWLAYANTLFYTVVGVSISMALTTTLAYALSRKKLVGRKFWILFTAFTLWFNAGLIPTYINYKELNLLDTRMAVLMSFAVNTYNLVIMKSFFEQLPEALEESAVIDGANDVTIFWKIFIPVSKPALATVGLFYAMARWNNYFWAMNLLQDDSKMPLQVLLKKIVVEMDVNSINAEIVTASSTSSPMTKIYALIIIVILPMLVAYPFVQKFFTSGIMVGSVKG